MPDVVGKIRSPDGSLVADTRLVKFGLVDAAGKPVHRGFLTDDETLLGAESVELDGAGDYSVTLPGNADISPSGTRWGRTLQTPNGERVLDPLIVPTTGGPYFEEALLAAPLEPLPEAAPSNEVDTVERTTDFGPVTAALGINATPVPGMVVEVPDIPRPCYIEAKGMLRIANADTPAVATVGIGPPGSAELLFTDLEDISTVFIGSVGTLDLDNTGRASVRIPANTPGEHQMYILAHNNTGGFPPAVAVSIVAAEHVKAFMRILAV